MIASATSADGAFSLGAAGVAAGGHALRTMCLEPELFEAAAMLAVQKDLMDILVRELKEELAAREEPVSGNKAWLRRRLGLHARQLYMCTYRRGRARAFRDLAS